MTKPSMTEFEAELAAIRKRIAGLQEYCGCGACVALRGGGQHHNGPCAVSRERDTMADGTSKNANLRMWEKLFEEAVKRESEK